MNEWKPNKVRKQTVAAREAEYGEGSDNLPADGKAIRAILDGTTILGRVRRYDYQTWPASSMTVRQVIWRDQHAVGSVNHTIDLSLPWKFELDPEVPEGLYF